MHDSNQKILSFDSMKEQVLVKSMTEDVVTMKEEQLSKKRCLLLSSIKLIMRHRQFDIAIEQNKGKGLNLTYNTCKILNPLVSLEEVTMMNTLSFGHRDLALYDTRVTIMEVINCLK